MGTDLFEITAKESGLNRERKTALRIAGVYALFGALWIALSDRLLAAMTDPANLTYLQTYKGWFFILVTASLVFLLSRRALGEQGRLMEQLQASDAAIRRLNADLEARVVERTSQLEGANKELEAFSYSVSHDLKAPLRGIDGYSRLLEEDYREKLDAEGRLFLQNIRQGAAQMNQLIDDLLAYSRMERRTLSICDIDLPSLVRGVVAERAHEIEETGVKLRVEIPAIRVSADHEGLSMVLRNLLENALKFSRNAHPPTVEIAGRIESDKLLLCFLDNGIGFDMKFHDRIFEMFSRLERVEDYPGTGVGLALVRRAVQRMGGRVWAESSPAQGSRFFLELPR